MHPDSPCLVVLRSTARPGGAKLLSLRATMLSISATFCAACAGKYRVDALSFTNCGERGRRAASGWQVPVEDRRPRLSKHRTRGCTFGGTGEGACPPLALANPLARRRKACC